MKLSIWGKVAKTVTSNKMTSVKAANPSRVSLVAPYLSISFLNAFTFPTKPVDLPPVLAVLSVFWDCFWKVLAICVNTDNKMTNVPSAASK